MPRLLLRRSMSWLVLLATLVLAGITMWIVVPAPTRVLLPLAVVAPEISPWLVSAAIVLATVGLALATPLGRVAAGLAALVALLGALPLVKWPGTVTNFDRAFARSGLVVPEQRRGQLRAHRLSLRELATGIDAGAPQIRRGLVVAEHGATTLTADVYFEPGRAPRPVVVQIYGGAWQRGAPADDAVFARYLATHGYVVCAIDYRHAPAWRWPLQLDDVRGALAWVRRHAAEYGGDASRLAIVGRSAGAELGLLAAYEPQSRVAAVVSYYGPTDLEHGWREPPVPDPLPVRPVLEAYLGGTPEMMIEEYRKASPLHHVTANVPPTLLVYGGRDHVVAPRFGRALDQRLREAGAVSVLLEIPWAEHAFDAVASGVGAQLALYYTERFLAATLNR